MTFQEQLNQYFQLLDCTAKKLAAGIASLAQERGLEKLTKAMGGCT